MSQMLAYEGASSSMDAQFQKYGATAALAEVFREQAEEAEASAGPTSSRRPSRPAWRPSPPRRPPRPPPRRSRRARSRSSSELARLQGISVELAEQRQAALEEIEREAREAAAAAAAAEAQAQAEAEAAAQAASEAADQAAQQADQQDDNGGTHRQHPARPRTPPPPPSTPPAPNGGAAAAIGFAKAQLGEPYVWGAAGPGSWDCSGLMMGAWGAGGVSLPHYSRRAVLRVHADLGRASSDPGDLVFWGIDQQPELDPPRRDVPRRRDDHPRAAHRAAGVHRLDVLLDPAELLRPGLTLSR